MGTPTSEAVYWYIEELTSKLIAETGIPNDRYHIGKIILRCFKDAPDFILQINGAKDEEETFRSALQRSIRCATAFRNLGLQFEDVVVIMAPNHNDLVIPIYASFYLGIMVAPIDLNLGVNELKVAFKRSAPKVIFCQSEKVETIQKALKLLDMTVQIVVFDDSKDYLSFSKFLTKYGEDTTVENFKPADFDAADANGILASTSGSTGLPKAVVMTHKTMMMSFPFVMMTRLKYPTPVNVSLNVSPLQWITGVFNIILAPLLKYTLLHTSSPLTQEHICYLFNKYKPESSFLSPTILTMICKHGNREKCDLSSLKLLFIGGSAVSKELVQQLKDINPNMSIFLGYGLTEATGLVFNYAHCPSGALGCPSGRLQVKLVDHITNEEIQKPNVNGELRIKGPSMSKCYYKNPEQTAAAFDEDGWFKTGDIMYRDEHDNYFYVDRIKMMLKYKSYQVSPVEVESVILKHPAVLDVIVTGIPDEECGDLPVALVICRNGHNVTAQEIKDLVKESLTDSKQLRGGVIFVREFPVTSSSKVDRIKIRELALTLVRE